MYVCERLCVSVRVSVCKACVRVCECVYACEGVRGHTHACYGNGRRDFRELLYSGNWWQVTYQETL